MEYLVDKTSVVMVDGEAIDIEKELPIRFYQFTFDKMRGLYLVNTDYKTSHGKIYGNATKIANHIVESYLKRDRNLGVLLSGGKGLGKSLTARLVIEQLHKKHPVIIVNQYIPGMFDFLKQISNAVILFDEFEKTIQGNVDGSDRNTDAPSKQDEMLSLLDGTAAGTHNLYLLTCNETGRLNDNLKSRPGRIAYHYRYESCTEETIRNYCADNLKKRDLEDEIVSELLATRYVSLDIIQALVDEVNSFDVTVPEAMEYMNIQVERINLEARVTYIDKNGKQCIDVENAGTWFTGRTNVGFEIDSTEEEDKAKMPFEGYIKVDMRNVRIPVYGAVDVSPYATINWSDYGGDYYQPKILKVELYDTEAISSRGRVCGYEDYIPNKVALSSAKEPVLTPVRGAAYPIPAEERV